MENVLRTRKTVIGKTLYTVRAIQSENARESAEQILIRLIKENMLNEPTSPEKRVNSGKSS